MEVAVEMIKRTILKRRCDYKGGETSRKERKSDKNMSKKSISCKVSTPGPGKNSREWEIKIKGKLMIKFKQLCKLWLWCQVDQL